LRLVCEGERRSIAYTHDIIENEGYFLEVRNTRVNIKAIRLCSKSEAVCRNSSRGPGLALETSVGDKHRVSSISGCITVVWSVPGRHGSTSQSVRWKSTDVVGGIDIDKLFS